MAEVRLMTAFGSVPLDGQDGIRRVIEDAIQQIAQEEGSFERAKAVFTESDEQCVFTVELDGVRKEPSTLILDLELLELLHVAVKAPQTTPAPAPFLPPEV